MSHEGRELRRGTPRVDAKRLSLRVAERSRVEWEHPLEIFTRSSVGIFAIQEVFQRSAGVYKIVTSLRVHNPGLCAIKRALRMVMRSGQRAEARLFFRSSRPS